jgi:hypothetical protein
MGREIKRVPLDFNLPIDEIWPGYLRRCGNWECEGCEDCNPVEPPAGEGWQLWTTTNEGSPMSPVFADAESLAQWMSREPCGFAGSRITLEDARRFVNGPGWSPSMVVRDGKLMDGITGL